MRKIRNIFSVCLAVFIMILASGCSQAGKASEPSRIALQGGTSDSIASLGYTVQSGSESDIASLNSITATKYETYDVAKPDVTVTMEGKEYTVKYSASLINRSSSPVKIDEYRGTDADGNPVTIMFKSGDTSKVIGYKLLGLLDKYDDWSLQINKLSEEQLVEIAKKAAAKYTDMGYYNDYSIEYYDSSIAGVPHSGYYVIIFYGNVASVRAADITQVRITPNGQVWWVTTPPTKGIANKVSSRLDAATCDAMAEEQITAMYCKEDAELEYVSRELSKRQLTLDDDGTPVIIYYYKVKLHDPNPLTRADVFTLPDTFTDFATVAVWLK